MKKILLSIAAITASIVLNAQNIPFGIGTFNPVADLHIHSERTNEPVIPPNPPRDDENPRIDPPEYEYYTTMQITNTTTGSTINDGLRLCQFGKDVTITQKEDGFVKLENAHNYFIMTSDGQIGIGAIYGIYNFSVWGKSKFGNNVMIDGMMTSQSIKVGDGLFCDDEGNLLVKHLKVTLTDWPDYVFSPEHRLLPLGEVEAYINEHSHLPGLPTAEEVELDGADLGEMNRLLMEKVEELTLYIIDLQKQIDELKTE